MHSDLNMHKIGSFITKVPFQLKVPTCIDISNNSPEIWSIYFIILFFVYDHFAYEVHHFSVQKSANK